MTALIVVVVVLTLLLLLGMAVRIVQQYQEGVLLRLGRVVGQHTLDQTLSETDKINLDIRKILDVTTVDWGVDQDWVPTSRSRLSGCRRPSSWSPSWSAPPGASPTSAPSKSFLNRTDLTCLPAERRSRRQPPPLPRHATARGLPWTTTSSLDCSGTQRRNPARATTHRRPVSRQANDHELAYPYPAACCSARLDRPDAIRGWLSAPGGTVDLVDSS